MMLCNPADVYSGWVNYVDTNGRLYFGNKTSSRISEKYFHIEDHSWVIVDLSTRVLRVLPT